MPPADETEIAEALARARRGLSPGAGDLERVRRGLSAALRAPAPAASSAPPAPHVWRRWMGRLALAGALAGTGAIVGYQAGRRAERRQLAAIPPPAPTTTIIAPAVPVERPPVEQPVPTRPASDGRKVERHRHLESSVAPQSEAESLAAEVRALRNTERALREKNPGLANAFLDGLDHEVPGGQMREERTALRAIARCSAGDQPFGVNLAEDFTQAFPSSAYRARVEQACDRANRTDPSSAGDSAGRR
jgi:hypothetical protein